MLAEPAAPAGPGVVDTDSDRQVVQTATASLAVDDPTDGAQQVRALVAAAGGRRRHDRGAAGGPDGFSDGLGIGWRATARKWSPSAPW